MTAIYGEDTIFIFSGLQVDGLFDCSTENENSVFPIDSCHEAVYLIFYPLTESQSCLRNNGKTNTVL